MYKKVDFLTPNDVYQKLVRDSEKIDSEINCDNIFNFFITANYLLEVLKRSPLNSSAVVENLITKLKKDKFIQLCIQVTKGKLGFSIEKEGDNAYLLIEDEKIDVFKIKNIIMDMYSTFFKIK